MCLPALGVSPPLVVCAPLLGLCGGRLVVDLEPLEEGLQTREALVPEVVPLVCHLDILLGNLLGWHVPEQVVRGRLCIRRDKVGDALWLGEALLLELALDGLERVLVLVLAERRERAHVVDERLREPSAHLVEIVEAFSRLVFGAPNPEPPAELSGCGLLLLLDVHVVELPLLRHLERECEVRGALGGGAEEHLADGRLLELRRRLPERHVLEERVRDASRHVLGRRGPPPQQLRLALHLPQRAVLGLFELVGAAGDARARESRTQIERHDDDGDGLPLLHGELGRGRRRVAVLPALGHRRLHHRHALEGARDHRLGDRRRQSARERHVEASLGAVGSPLLEASDARRGEDARPQRVDALAREQLEEPLRLERTVAAGAAAPVAARVRIRVEEFVVDRDEGLAEPPALDGGHVRRVVADVELEHVRHARTARAARREAHRREDRAEEVLLGLLRLGPLLRRHRIEGHLHRVLVRVRVDPAPLEPRRSPRHRLGVDEAHEAGGVVPDAPAEELAQPVPIEHGLAGGGARAERREELRRLARPEAGHPLQRVRAVLVRERLVDVVPERARGVDELLGERLGEALLRQLGLERVEREREQREPGGREQVRELEEGLLHHARARERRAQRRAQLGELGVRRVARRPHARERLVAEHHLEWEERRDLLAAHHRVPFAARARVVRTLRTVVGLGVLVALRAWEAAADGHREGHVLELRLEAPAEQVARADRDEFRLGALEEALHTESDNNDRAFSTAAV